MISIITCSIKPDICKEMLESVNKTIGAEYEAIVFDNRERKYGICKAYNEAAQKSKGDYLCFVHEDILFRTNNWGRELINFTKHNYDCGVISVAGSKRAFRNFFYWCDDNRSSLINIYQSKNKKNNYSENSLLHSYINPNNEIFSKAVCLDGLFLFVKKNIWEDNKFDEDTFNGFHFYDADFTFSVSQKFQNYVYFGINICHFSKGNFDRTYFENMYKFQKKWKNKLPYCLSGYRVSFQEELETAQMIYSHYRVNKLSRIECLKMFYEINGIIFSFIFLLKILFPYYVKQLFTSIPPTSNH